MRSNLLFGLAALIGGALGLGKGLLIDRKGEKFMANVDSFVMQNGNKFPVVKFDYHGKEITMRAANADTRNKLSEGDEVEIICRSENAQYVNIVGDNLDIVFSAVLLVLGIILVVLSIL